MDRLAIIDSESRRFAEVLPSTEPTTRCPTCPDWSAADLLWHLTEVHYFWAGILGQRVLTADGLPAVEAAKPERPSGVADLLALREEATTRLVNELADRDDADPCWSWWPPDQTVGFTRRMQTYEATMHRVDAELAAGVSASPLGPDVAAGAVDHAVDVMWGWMPDGATARSEAVVEFVAADTPARWLVDVGSWAAPTGESAPWATRAAAGEPTAVVTATVEDLALWAWTRGGSVSVTGQPQAVAALDALLAQGMP